MFTFIRPSAFCLACDVGRRTEGPGHVCVHPWRVCRGLPTSVCELYADEGALRMREVHDALERLDLAVSPESLRDHRQTRESANRALRLPRLAERCGLPGRRQ